MRLARFAWAVLAYNLLVILWGATVRATGSGAGCGGHWPLCNGEVVPRAARLETLIEFSHRAMSGLAFLLVLGLAAATWRALSPGHPGRRAAFVALLLMIIEAALGAGLVLFQLVAENATAARALFMATHLVNTFFLLAALALTAYWTSGAPGWQLGGRPRAVGLALLGLGAVLLSGTSGAIAALGDTLFPPASLGAALAQEISATSHFLIRLRLLHPAIALATAVVLILVALRLPRLSARPAARPWGLAVLVLTSFELAAGLVNVVLLAPIWLQLVHLLLADLLWISLLLLGAAALARMPGEVSDRPRVGSPALAPAR